MTLNEYLESLRGKSAAVLGLGVSNAPLARLLLGAGVSVTARDKRERDKLGQLADELEGLGARLVLGEEYLDNLTEDIVFRTPGIHPHTPELLAASGRGSVITSEMEAFFAVCPCRIIAVTGSDGKTTTSTLISEILKAGGYTVHLGGNIGTPLLERAPDMSENDIAVLELSSFQLHGMHCAPDVAVVTNLTPNHLDIHPSMEDYAEAKRMIFRNQRPDGVLVINATSELLRGFDSEAPGNVRYFNTDSTNECAFMRDSEIIDRCGGAECVIMRADDIKIPGSHNAENYMAAILATWGLVDIDVYKSVAGCFAGVKHRLELVRELRGVKYINDSIASSPTRTIAGLRAISAKPHLIAGGYDKHIPFDELGREICERVRALYLTGDTAEQIRGAVTAAPEYDSAAMPIYMARDLEDAVKTAHEAAREGNIVLMSPACASFDRFKNFEERGERFREIVTELE